MNRLTTILVACAATLALLAGCSTGSDAARWNAIKAKHDADLARENRLAEQESRADAAMLTLAGTDAQTKANAQSYFQMKGIMSVAFRGGQGPASGSDAAMYAPEPDKALQWAGILLNPLASVTQGYLNYKQGKAQAEYNYLSAVSSNQMWGSVMNTGYNTIGNVATAGINKPVFALPLPSASTSTTVPVE